MTVAGELALTVQIALRAAATGYQVLVCTARPERWKEATGAGLQVVGEAGLAQQLAPARRRWMVVYDEVSDPSRKGRRSRCARWKRGWLSPPMSISSRRA